MFPEKPADRICGSSAQWEKGPGPCTLLQLRVPRRYGKRDAPCPEQQRNKAPDSLKNLLPEYITILIITNLTFVFTTISEKSYKIYKIISSLITTLIDLLFIMIIGIISKNHIDISSDVKLYSDSTILTLLQISMGLFVSLYLLLMLARIHWRLKLYDKNVTFDNEVYPDMGLYIKNNSTDAKISDEYIRVFKVIDFSDKGRK